MIETYKYVFASSVFALHVGSETFADHPAPKVNKNTDCLVSKLCHCACLPSVFVFCWPRNHYFFKSFFFIFSFCFFLPSLLVSWAQSALPSTCLTWAHHHCVNQLHSELESLSLSLLNLKVNHTNGIFPEHLTALDPACQNEPKTVFWTGSLLFNSSYYICTYARFPSYAYINCVILMYMYCLMEITLQ